MSLLWEPKEERMKKIEKLKALANTVDGLPRLLKGVGDEIGKQFYASLNALQGYHEEQHKEVMSVHLALEKNMMAAVAAVTASMERQKAEFGEQLQNAQRETLQNVGAMIAKLDGKLGALSETSEESRAIGFGIAEIIQRTIDAVSEGVANLGPVTEMVSAHKEKHADRDISGEDYFSRSDRM